MRRRRFRTLRFQSRLVRLVVGVALIAWMGIILLAILNYQAPAPAGFDADTASSPVFESSSPAGELAQGPAAAPKSRSTPAAPSQARLRGPAVQAVTDRDDQGFAADTAQSSEMGDPADGAADMAQLETVREAEPSIAPKVKRDITPDKVARAQFTTGIEEREPINRVDAVFSMDGEVYSTDGRALSALYYFTELEGMRGETVLHRWEHEGETVAQASFEVDGDPWSVYSRQDLPPATGGEWRVVVIDAQGNVIKTDDFSYQNF